MSRLTAKFRTFSSLTTRERTLAFRVWLLTIAVRLALWVLPFQSIRRMATSAGASRSSRMTAREVAWAVQLAGRYVPRATCLTQALTAQVLLNRAGLENRLHIGVALDNGFASHAWIEYAGRVLIGGGAARERYSPILTLEGTPAGD